MALNFFDIRKGINLQPVTGSTVTIKGDVAYNNTSNQLELFTTAVESLTTATNTQTLTNKSISGLALSGTITGTPTFSGLVTFSSAGTAISVTNNATIGGTLTVPTIASGTGTFTLNTSGAITVPNATDTLVGKATTDTLTNKTLTGNTAVNLVSGTGTIIFNTTGTITVPNATDTLVGKTTTDTLTNKTLTTPTINGASLSGTLSGTPTFSGAVTFSAAGTAVTINNNALVSGTISTAAVITTEANPASTGFIRLANNGNGIFFRNSTNSGNISINVDASNQLTYNGGAVFTSGGILTSTAFPALTGDVTTTAGSLATTVAKIQGTTVSGTTGSGNVVFSAAPTMSGIVTVGSLALTSGNEGTLGSVGFNATDGLYLRGKTGTANDFMYLTVAGSNIISNPTGTENLKFNTDSGNSTFGSTVIVQGNITANNLATVGTSLVMGTASAITTNTNSSFIYSAGSALTGNANGDLVLIPRSSTSAGFYVYTGSPTPVKALNIDASQTATFTGAVISNFAGRGIQSVGAVNGSSQSLYAQNTDNTGTTTPSLTQLFLQNNAAAGFRIQLANSGATGTIVTNGPSGKQVVLFTDTIGYPMVLGTNNTAAIKIDGTTQAVSIVGTNTNDNAASTFVGEFVSSTIAAGSAITLTTATAANITSISLTAGDWDVSAIAYYNGTLTGTVFTTSISQTSATQDTTSGVFIQSPTAPTAVSDISHPIPSVRKSLSGTTTIYLVATGTFTVGTGKAYGALHARRVR